jgi:UDP-2,4-diacetamido-2,4,6-trideoxy-beta-L-altropyranose hydrolase
VGRPDPLIPRDGSHARVTLRPATPQDAALLLEWRNDPVAVRFSVTGRSVAPEEHAAWLRTRLEDPNTLLWLAEEGSTAVAQVRVDLENGVGTVSIGVAPEARGRGVASATLRAMLEAMERDPRATRLRAVAHPDNGASVHAFEAIGFRRLGRRQRDFIVLERSVGANR